MKRTIVIILLAVSLFSLLFGKSASLDYDSVKSAFESVSSGSLDDLSTDVNSVMALFKYWKYYDPSRKQYFKAGYGWSDGSSSYTYSVTFTTEYTSSSGSTVYERVVLYTQSGPDKDALHPPKLLNLLFLLDHDAFSSSVTDTVLSCLSFVVFALLSILLLVWFLFLFLLDLVGFTFNLAFAVLQLIGLA